MWQPLEAAGLQPPSCWQSQRKRSFSFPRVLIDPVCVTVTVAREKEYTDWSDHSHVWSLIRRSGTLGERPGLKIKKWTHWDEDGT